MNNDPEIFDDDLDLENLLKPKAHFRVSTDFKQRVMEEAKAIPLRRRRRWMPVAALSAAASIAALVILAFSLFRNQQSSADAPVPVTASVEAPGFPSSDTIQQKLPTPLIAEATQPIHDTPSAPRRTGKKKSPSKVGTSPQFIRNDASEKSQSLPVIEGEMRKTSHEGPLDPDKVRSHLIETRRNAEMAYIEQMREEIEANQAYIAQLMAEADVNQ